MRACIAPLMTSTGDTKRCFGMINDPIISRRFKYEDRCDSTECGRSTKTQVGVNLFFLFFFDNYILVRRFTVTCRCVPQLAAGF